MTRRTLADELQVSLTTIDTYRKAGMPSYLFGPRGRRFVVSECKMWAARGR